MDSLQAEFADAGVQSVFIYVREAHPGEYYPHHDSFERKLEHAREFKRLFDCKRPMLIDDMTGSAHRAFGGLPNMTYIVNPAHTIMFRSDWTDAPTVRFALSYLTDVARRRREGERLAPFYAELLGFRANDPSAFDAALERNGPKAITEMREARELWARGEHLGAVRRKRS
ncbi:hypothetical protein BH23CHL2_BH23CHL2_24140 [soil metagenome]